jgi:hypothetical protein
MLLHPQCALFSALRSKIRFQFRAIVSSTLSHNRFFAGKAAAKSYKEFIVPGICLGKHNQPRFLTPFKATHAATISAAFRPLLPMCGITFPQI